MKIFCTIALLSLSFFGSEAIAEELPDDFFGINDHAQNQQKIGEVVRDLPIFPILGNASAPVKVDYFYSASCKPCQASSKAIYDALSNDLPIQVSFHPIIGNQNDYDSAVSESILNSVSPLAFSLFHFLKMSSDHEEEVDTGSLFKEVSRIIDNYDTTTIRMQNHADWIRNIEVSRMIAEEIEVSSLPTMIIGDRKYAGFSSYDAFVKVIEEMASQDIETPLP